MCESKGILSMILQTMVLSKAERVLKDKNSEHTDSRSLGRTVLAFKLRGQTILCVRILHENIQTGFNPIRSFSAR